MSPPTAPPTLPVGLSASLLSSPDATDPGLATLLDVLATFFHFEPIDHAADAPAAHGKTQDLRGLITTHPRPTLAARRPLLPVETAAQLADPHRRAHFITRVFAHDAWMRLCERPRPGALVALHIHYRPLLHAHDPFAVHLLDALVAQASSSAHFAALVDRYGAAFMAALARPPAKHRLGHAMPARIEAPRSRPASHAPPVVIDASIGPMPVATPMALLAPPSRPPVDAPAALDPDAPTPTARLRALPS
jgi:hypothetical protein